MGSMEGASQQHYGNTNRFNCTDVKQQASVLAHSVHSGSQYAGQQRVSTSKFAPFYCWFDETLCRDEKASAGGSSSQEETSTSAH